MATLQPIRTGLVVAIFIGSGHLLWAVLVAVGWAQPLVNFIFWIHLIKPVYVVERFDAGVALLLVAVTAGIGYAVGSVFALLWNRIHR